MGEARRRREARLDAYAIGRPVPRPDCCPGCSSKSIVVGMADGMLETHMGAIPVGVCRDCTAVWEAFPPTYVEDPVCSEPCDNCAFRPGSHEQQDAAGWRDLIAKLRPTGDLLSGDRFYCHKNVPIDMSKGPGNFLFSTVGAAPAEDGLQLPFDQSRMRVCSGYLRMLWQLNGAAKQRKEAGPT